MEDGLKRSQAPFQEGARLLSDELEELRLQGLFRELKTFSGVCGTHAEWKGREIILFYGNDYLGLSRHPKVIKAGQEAFQKYGAGSGAARLISGTSDLHTRLEEELALFKKKERALIFGSGYLANLGTLSALAGEKDVVIMDKLCHASLIDGARLSGATLRVFPHKNYSKCEEILSKNASGSYRRRILVSDTVFSMDGDIADLEALTYLKEKYDALLVVDDAHGIGVFGEKGTGLTEGKLNEKIDAVVGTLSKALGVFGGFAAGSSVLIDQLINFSRPFIFATAPPPALQAAAMKALTILQEDDALRQKLWRNCRLVYDFLSKRGQVSDSKESSGLSPFKGTVPGDCPLSPIFPILIGPEKEALKISEALLQQGLLIPAIRYPSVPRGRARLRLTVSAAHTKEDLEKLFEAFSNVFP